jgi:hypothetical protein
MARNRRIPRSSSSTESKAQPGVLGQLLAGAEDRLWQGWLDSHRAFKHSGTKGTTREGDLRSFLAKQLPARFAIATGEAIDIRGSRTPQIDVMIYDRLEIGPFFVTETDALLPAEALLATIEVKSVLDKGAVEQFAAGTRAVHLLRPYGKRFAFPRSGGAHNDGTPRVQSSLFAFESDLAETNWATKEMVRTRAAARAERCRVEAMDRLVVLGRGLILPGEGQALPTSEMGALRIWFFHLVNFLAREAARRPLFPWSKYAYPGDDSIREQVATPIVPGRSSLSATPPNARPTDKRATPSDGKAKGLTPDTRRRRSKPGGKG